MSTNNPYCARIPYATTILLQQKNILATLATLEVLFLKIKIYSSKRVHI
jgi:hypothetical protein